ncbi:MAG: DUF934 domain-containing protein [Hyphomicrobiaceae bacterium]|nr:DUF934 domain-containing protein [Hyphomicrobiaceae bacterium]
MLIYRNGTFTNDPWHRLGDALPIRHGRRQILPLAIWRTVLDDAAYDPAMTGVDVNAHDVEASDLMELSRVALVVITFPKFTDGRAYSLARRLRDSFGYQGGLRATGDVLLDQIGLMERCGFDSFEIVHAPTIRALEASRIPSLATVYQAGAIRDHERARPTSRRPERRHAELAPLHQRG